MFRISRIAAACGAWLFFGATGADALRLLPDTAAGAADTRSWSASFKTVDGYLQIDITDLSGYEYTVGDEAMLTGDTGLEKLRATHQIPARVRALNGRKVRLPGFVMPLDFSEGLVRSFLLMPNQSACCYGVMPQINEIVYVKMRDNRGAKAQMDIPMLVYGKLSVGESLRDGSVFCLYYVEADKVEPSPDGVKLKDEIRQLQESLIKKRKP